MTFTQYVFPNGRTSVALIDRPATIEKLANELMDAGWSFEIECFPDTQMVHMDCCNAEKQLASRVCQNGPDVPVRVDELVIEAHGKLVQPNTHSHAN